MSGASLGRSVKDPLIQSADRPPVPPDLIFYTTAQIAQLLEIGEEAVKVYLREGAMKGAKLGGRWRVSQTQLREFVQDQFVHDQSAP